MFNLWYILLIFDNVFGEFENAGRKLLISWRILEILLDFMSGGINRKSHRFLASKALTLLLIVRCLLLVLLEEENAHLLTVRVKGLSLCL